MMDRLNVIQSSSNNRSDVIQSSSNNRPGIPSKDTESELILTSPNDDDNNDELSWNFGDGEETSQEDLPPPSYEEAILEDH